MASDPQLVTAGGINSEGAKLFNLYRSWTKRGTHRTDYVASDAGAHDKQAFAPHCATGCGGAAVLSATT